MDSMSIAVGLKGKTIQSHRSRKGNIVVEVGAARPGGGRWIALWRLGTRRGPRSRAGGLRGGRGSVARFCRAFPLAEHLHLVDHDLGGIAFDARLVGPFPGPQRTGRINRRSFF